MAKEFKNAAMMELFYWIMRDIMKLSHLNQYKYNIRLGRGIIPEIVPRINKILVYEKDDISKTVKAYSDCVLKQLLH